MRHFSDFPISRASAAVDDFDSTQVLTRTRNDQDSKSAPLVELAKPTFYLTITRGGEYQGKVVQIEKPLTMIGRTGADIEIEDSEASQRHAQIEIATNVVTLRDLGSTTGTFVRGKKVTVTTLEDGWEFQIGGTIFILHVVTTSLE